MINPKIYIGIPTHRQKSRNLLRTLKHYSESKYKVIIFVHYTELAFFRKLLKNRNIQIITHRIPQTASPHMGLLKHRVFCHLQSIMKSQNIAIMMDDDLCESRFINIFNVPRYLKEKISYARNLYPGELKQHIFNLANTAQKYNYPYFTFAPNSRIETFRRSKPQFYDQTFFFLGFLGFFKHSPNPFNKEIPMCEDFWAAKNIATTAEQLNILADFSIVQRFAIGTVNYKNQGNRHQPREQILVILSWMTFKNKHIFFLSHKTSLNQKNPNPNTLTLKLRHSMRTRWTNNNKPIPIPIPIKKYIKGGKIK